MLLSEIISQLNEFCAPSFASDWDNPGLQAGRTDLEVSSVYLAVDATSEVIEDAIRCDCDLILTHHPLLFHGIQHVSDQDYIGKRILRLLQNDMALFAMHTNFDVLAMATEASDYLGLTNAEVLEVTYEDAISREGFGRIGELQEHLSLMELAQLVKEKFSIPHVRFYGDPDQAVVRCAILPGSGHDAIDLAIEKGADVMITGDITHHVGIDAVEKGIGLIDAGHYGVEKIFIPYMKQFLKKQMPDLMVFCAPEKEPFTEV